MNRELPGPSRWARARARYRWLDHLALATNRYFDYGGYHYVASITYFSLLSLVPILMLASSVGGFVLASQPQLLDQLLHAISGTLPGSLGDKAAELLTGFVEQRTSVGVAGLVVGLYSGWNWMNSLRDALTAMYGQNRSDQPLLRTIAVDVLALLGLAAALLVSFGITVSGTAVGHYLLGLIGVADTSWGRTVLSVVSVPLALAADWLVFLWVLTRLPRERVGWRSAMRGAVAAALGFELLKQAGGFYLSLISVSPTGVAFGSVIGLLFFISLIARMLVYITAWTATARDAPRKPIPPPTPTELRPVAAPRHNPAGPLALGAVLGALGTVFALRGRRRSRS
ncbi:YhjD/YihY/BrkB family envelope integrity protein [Amycolatopsis sp. FDAARGOS 1241]|uniref:YhjD/YihY/BrkB family envelope integrity protein n=1 Tax=Amycolatopsis sp. FDAARGOS 1241 TaxID=2778070 RepID=UPI00351C3183